MVEKICFPWGKCNFELIAEMPSFVNGFETFYETFLGLRFDIHLYTSQTKMSQFFSVFSRIKCPIIVFFVPWEGTKKRESHVNAWDSGYTSLQVLCILCNFWPWLFIYYNYLMTACEIKTLEVQVYIQQYLLNREVNLFKV